jgi:hypothetical protein
MVFRDGDEQRFANQFPGFEIGAQNRKRHQCQVELRLLTQIIGVCAIRRLCSRPSRRAPRHRFLSSMDFGPPSRRRLRYGL